ncbi:hypothetical protein ACFQ9Z_17760 [Streptomyces sp. NPDC056580]|uniref:hypothetical protein n=1 Tax=Streptomyces sp. NPDC056580 TaxID=3345872 RepID=UPI00369F50E6
MAEGEVADIEQAVRWGRLSVAATTTDGVHVLTVAGEIDRHTGDALGRALDLTGTPRPHVVVDLQQARNR